MLKFVDMSLFRLTREICVFLFFAAVLAVSFPTCHGADSALRGILISGNLTFDLFTEFGKRVHNWSSTNRFHILLDSRGRYEIQVNPMAQEEEITLTYDGTDTFFTYCFKATNNMDFAYISSGSYPFCPVENQKRANILWLAFASGQHIQEMKKETMPLPWIPARISLSGYGFRLKSDLFPEFPYSPKRLKFLRDTAFDLPTFEEELERPELDSPSGEKKVASLKKDWTYRINDWRNGFIAAELICSEFTNCNQFHIPISFTFESYYPYKQLLSRRAIGVVTNVEDLGPEHTFLPQVRSLLRVEDTRFRARELGLNKINYPVTNVNEWKPAGDPSLKAQFAAVKQGAGATGHFVSSKVQRKRIAISFALLIVGLGVPVLLYFFTAAKRKRESRMP